MPKLVEVKPLAGHRLYLRYDDGAAGEVDLSALAGQGVFAAWNQPGVFEQARLGEAGQVCWGDDLDLCPDALYLRLTGQAPEELFPSLRNAAVDARYRSATRMS